MKEATLLRKKSNNKRISAKLKSIKVKHGLRDILTRTQMGKAILKRWVFDSFHLQESVVRSFASLGLGHVLRHKAKTSSSFCHLVLFLTLSHSLSEAVLPFPQERSFQGSSPNI